MLRTCSEHVAITVQTSDARLVGCWEGVRFFPRPTSDQEHYPFFSDRGVEPGAVSYRVLASLLA
jgi:hypothetical protein